VFYAALFCRQTRKDEEARASTDPERGVSIARFLSTPRMTTPMRRLIGCLGGSCRAGLGTLKPGEQVHYLAACGGGICPILLGEG